MDRTGVVATSPVFVVANLQRAIDFYCGKLGFREPNSWGEPPCFAMMHRDMFDLMLSLAPTPAQVQPNGRLGIWDLYIKVFDIAAEEAALRSAGVELIRGPETAFYGLREIEVVDPDGYRICLAQRVHA